MLNDLLAHLFDPIGFFVRHFSPTYVGLLLNLKGCYEEYCVTYEGSWTFCIRNI